MDKDFFDAQLAGDGAAVLATGTAKAGQDVRRALESLGLGESPNWAAHRLVCLNSDRIDALGQGIKLHQDSVSGIATEIVPFPEIPRRPPPR